MQDGRDEIALRLRATALVIEPFQFAHEQL
jgi:hypothetical protein